MALKATPPHLSHSPLRGGSPWLSARPAAPWAESLSPEVACELELRDVAEVESDRFDVIVIGAGIAGLTATVTAAATGARVLTLEAAPSIGHGATGRNAGILSAGINMMLADLPADSPHRAMWPATTHELLALVDEANRPGALLSASQTGALSLAETAAAARRLEREARARLSLGLRAELWTSAQVSDNTGGRLETRGVAAALWLPDEGRIQPLTLLAHAAAMARAAGATLAGNARVARWEAHGKRGSAHWTVTVDNGRMLTARCLIVATGPVVEPNARIYAVAFPIGLPETFPLFWDAAPYTYCDYRPGPGYIVSSGGRYGRAGGSRREDAYYQRLAHGARHWLPELTPETPSHAWAVDLDVAADLAPTARDLNAPAPGVAIEGLGALGVLPGVVLAREAGSRIARLAQ
jgi:L-pipecolate oxidase